MKIMGFYASSIMTGSQKIITAFCSAGKKNINSKHLNRLCSSPERGNSSFRRARRANMYPVTFYISGDVKLAIGNEGQMEAEQKKVSIKRGYSTSTKHWCVSHNETTSCRHTFAKTDKNTLTSSSLHTVYWRNTNTAFLLGINFCLQKHRTNGFNLKFETVFIV